MLSIGMITAPRDLDVHDAIAELRAAGFSQDIHLFCEPGVRAIRPAPHLIVHVNQTTRGGLGNWAYCLRWLYENTAAPYLMVCEDDVIFNTLAATKLFEFLVEHPDGFGYVSLYTPRHDARFAAGGTGWLSWNRGRETWGTQAICFNRRSAECVLAYEPLASEDQMTGPTDAIVGECFQKARFPCYYHNPSLADHVGRVSAVGRRWSNRNSGLNFSKREMI